MTMTMIRLQPFLLIVLIVILSWTNAFVPLSATKCHGYCLFKNIATLCRALPTPEESAQALTDYLAKAHEEKIRAMADVEAKYKQEIEDLKAKLEQYQQQQQTSNPPVATASDNSYNTFAFPATNKELGEKVRAYRAFLSDYLIKAQTEKFKAVAAAEEKSRKSMKASFLS